MTDETAHDPVNLSRTLAGRLKADQTQDEKAFADAIVAQLRADRLIWPVRASGDLWPMGDAARVVCNVARLSGSAGLILAMHMSQAMSLLFHAKDSAFLKALTGALVAEQALVASGTSEKGVGGDIFGSICTIEEAADGALSLTKDTPNISYMDHAGAVLISAMRVQPNGRKVQVLVAVKRDALDAQPGPTTDLLGMRGILNRPYRLTATFQPQAIFAEPYPVIARDTMTPTIHIFWAALWSGIAGNVLDKAKIFLASQGAAADEATALATGQLSRLIDRHYAMNALIRDAIAQFEAKSANDAVGLLNTTRVKRLKVVCSDLLQDICQGALGLIGMRAYAETGPYSVAAPLRDAASARVMISNYRLLAANTKVDRFVEEGL